MWGKEDNLQAGCVKWMQLQYPKEAGLLHHSPNGGSRFLAEAAKFKAMGVRRGFPDLFLAIASHGYHGLFIEMKTATGRQSKEQKWWQGKLEKGGYKYCLVRDVDTFQHVINDYLDIANEL